MQSYHQDQINTHNPYTTPSKAWHPQATYSMLKLTTSLPYIYINSELQQCSVACKCSKVNKLECVNFYTIQDVNS